MSLSSSTAADGDELVVEHQHSDSAELPTPPPREILDAAGELLRALAAPVRIAIVLQLHVSQRMTLLAKVLAGILALLVTVAGYIRLEELTKGYYTRWLRLAVVGCVSRPPDRSP